MAKTTILVRILNSVSGSSYSFGAGAVVEVASDIANDLIQAGHAVVEAEKASSKQAERAEKRAAK